MSPIGTSLSPYRDEDPALPAPLTCNDNTEGSRAWAIGADIFLYYFLRKLKGNRSSSEDCRWTLWAAKEGATLITTIPFILIVKQQKTFGAHRCLTYSYPVR